MNIFVTDVGVNVEDEISHNIWLLKCNTEASEGEGKFQRRMRAFGMPGPAGNSATGMGGQLPSPKLSQPRQLSCDLGDICIIP